MSVFYPISNGISRHRALDPILWTAIAFLVLRPTHATAAEDVTCLYTYGGETKRLVASPVSSPYEVPAIKIGSHFRLRVVFQDQPVDFASIKVYAYGERDRRSVLIQQATFAYPVLGKPNSRYGFTGRQQIYEPVQGAELDYWCRMEGEIKR